MEQAGRILRAQASRKQVFLTVVPLLTAELIKPALGKRKAHQDYRLIKEKVSQLREALVDPDSLPESREADTANPGRFDSVHDNMF